MPVVTPRFYNFRYCDRPCSDPNAIITSEFPVGTINVYYAWDYENMAIGTPYTRIWYTHNEEWVSYYCTWQGPSNGTFYKKLWDSEGLRSGSWTIVLSLNNAEVIRETVYVAGSYNQYVIVGQLPCQDF